MVIDTQRAMRSKDIAELGTLKGLSRPKDCGSRQDQPDRPFRCEIQPHSLDRQFDRLALACHELSQMGIRDGRGRTAISTSFGLPQNGQTARGAGAS
jgi:hypothetical protein